MNLETQIIIEPILYLLIMCTTWLVVIGIFLTIFFHFVAKSIYNQREYKHKRDIERIKENTKLAEKKITLNKDDRQTLSDVSDKDLLDEVFRRQK